MRKLSGYILLDKDVQEFCSSQKRMIGIFSLGVDCDLCSLPFPFVPWYNGRNARMEKEFPEIFQREPAVGASRWGWGGFPLRSGRRGVGREQPLWRRVGLLAIWVVPRSLSSLG